MKKFYLLLVFLFILSFGKGFSQRCISFNCAASHAGVVADGTLTDSTISSGMGCWVYTVKEIFWHFFMPIQLLRAILLKHILQQVQETPCKLEYLVFDCGTSAPNVNCPVDASSWNRNFVFS